MSLKLCHCAASDFTDYVNEQYGHVVTGNLNIVQDHFLAEIMNLGAKFRLPNATSKQAIINIFKKDLDIFIHSLSSYYGYPLDTFFQWHSKVFSEFKLQIDNIYSFSQHSPFNFTLHKVKDSIIDLQNKFVIMYIDKATNNYAIICKKILL